MSPKTTAERETRQMKQNTINQKLTPFKKRKRRQRKMKPSSQ